MSGANRILRETLSTVLAELERIDSRSLVAARARGLLDALEVAPKGRPVTVDDEEVARLYGEGLSLEQCSIRLGVSASTVVNSLKRSGVERKRTRPLGQPSKADPRLPEMVAMRENGATLEEIGAHFKITRERARQIFARAGIDISVRPLTPAERAAVDRYVSGESLGLCAASLGIMPTSFRNVLLRAGHEPRKEGRATRPETKHRTERAAQLWQAGKRPREIAAELGLPCTETVYRYLARAGISVREGRP